MQLERETMKKIMFLIVFTFVCLGVVLYYDRVLHIFRMIWWMAFPFVIGFSIAFIINVLLNRVEAIYTNLLQPKEGALSYKLRRPLCLVISLLLISSLLVFLLLLVVPEIINSMRVVFNNIPIYVSTIEHFYMNIKETYSLTFLPEWDFNALNWDQISMQLTDWLSSYGQNIINNTISTAGSIVSFLVTFFLGLIFSIYVLGQKETLYIQFSKVLYAYLPVKIVNRIYHIASVANKTFSNFINGQLMECALIGIVTFIGMIIMGIPYAPMIAAMIAFGALIPVFGATLSLLLGALLVALVNPMQALMLIIFVVIYQQIDGNFIYPRIVGNQVGLPGIWVLAAVSLGSSFAGMIGMIIGVPLFSVFYTLFREYVYNRLKKKRLIDKDKKLIVKAPIE